MTIQTSKISASRIFKEYTPYDDINDMWVSALRDIIEIGDSSDVDLPSRDGNVFGEIIGWCGLLTANHQKTLLTVPERKLSVSYAAAETLWYLSSSDSVKMISEYAPSYVKFSDINDRAYGAYGPRVMPQLARVIDILKRTPNSRQAVISVWRPNDLDMIGKTNDLPCTLSMQFYIRNGRLHLTVTMRSNDIWLGMPYDIFAFTCIQRLVASELGISVGAYIHSAGSLHLYSRNLAAAKKCLGYTPRHSDGHDWDLALGLNGVSRAVFQERHMRLTGENVPHAMAASVRENEGSMLSDLVAMCSQKTLRRPLAVKSPRVNSIL